MPVWTGALVIAGDVAFFGGMDRWFKAVDRPAVGACSVNVAQRSSPRNQSDMARSYGLQVAQ